MQADPTRTARRELLEIPAAAPARAVAPARTPLLQFQSLIADFWGEWKARPRWLNVDNSLAAGRRLAVQVVLAQMAAAVIAGLLFEFQGAASALGAFGGGGVVAVGTAALAFRVFRPSLARGAVTMRRFALGTLLKWVVVLGGLFLLLVRLHLPLVPVVVGAGAAMAVNWLVLRFEI